MGIMTGFLQTGMHSVEEGYKVWHGSTYMYIHVVSMHLLYLVVTSAPYVRYTRA